MDILDRLRTALPIDMPLDGYRKLRLLQDCIDEIVKLRRLSHRLDVGDAGLVAGAESVGFTREFDKNNSI